MSVTPLPDVPQRSDPANFSARADAFLGALPTFCDELNDTADAVTASETTAGGYANAAAASASAASADAASANAAAVAAASASAMSGTSTTSTTIGTGSKSLTTQTGKSFLVGQFVVVAYTTTPANYMLGQVTSYTSGTGAIVVNVTQTGGSGTYAAWTISPCSAPLKPYNVTAQTGATYTANSGDWVMCQGALQQTITLPAGATDRRVRVSVDNGRYDVAVAPASGERISGLPANETVVIDSPYGDLTLEYANATKGWEIV